MGWSKGSENRGEVETEEEETMVVSLRDKREDDLETDVKEKALSPAAAASALLSASSPSASLPSAEAAAAAAAPMDSY